MRQVEIDNDKNLAEALAKLNAMAAEHQSGLINWNSPQQVAKFLYDVLHLPVTVKTDKGAPSTGEGSSLRYQGQAPVADQLIQYREYEKFRSTYLEGWSSTWLVQWSTSN